MPDEISWLDVSTDYPAAREYWAAFDQPLTFSTWETAHQFGYQYAAILRDGNILSCAAVWKFSDDTWEIAAVSTLPEHRQKGYSKQVITFLTMYTLEQGRKSVCSTNDDNAAMIATIKSVGYEELPEDKIWWVYPRLPDF